MRKILKFDGVSEGQADLSDSSCDRCLLECVVYRYCICADRFGGSLQEDSSR